MKIRSYKKINGNRYEIIFDNDLTLKLYDDVIVKSELLLKKDITDSELKKLEKDNETLDSYYLAIAYINRKMRSEKEIKEYLKKKEFNVEDINKTIQRLKEEGLINNKAYLTAYIYDNFNLTSKGYYKILSELINLGFVESEITSVLDEIDNNLWHEKLEKLIDKKIKTNHNQGINKLKDKIILDLVRLGYDRDEIVESLSHKEINDNNILLKEFNKIKPKLSRKYSGKELEMQIRNKLYQKGFNVDDINSLID